MAAAEPILMSWSGGKDSAVALHELQRAGREIAGLMTMVAGDADRVSVHGVPRDLVRRQAAALGLPLHEVVLPSRPSNLEYEAAIGDLFAAQRAAGVGTVAFGDLFLEDIRAYRDALCARLGMAPIYPVWGRETRAFAAECAAYGFRPVLCCVDLARLDLSFAGRELDAALVADLPPGVDPCGENGEFHTFVFDGPNFARPIPIEVGGREARDGFGYCAIRAA
ncbi:hypothetical protein [Phenylobacterium sp.]|uniref:Dph6-related ATP pyrophosphatase n=1 Tax=Phenylobacterium sp. TaxID=1871053 RepID=UPI002B95A89D|nr:hypothetical protein [Phenylobacterium sp.]HLZ74096.1 hypothetical protein [Phenylobacterium sp.]